MPVGVLLLDPVKDRLYVRVRCDWDHLDAEETEILEAMEQGLQNTGSKIPHADGLPAWVAASSIR